MVYCLNPVRGKGSEKEEMSQYIVYCILDTLYCLLSYLYDTMIPMIKIRKRDDFGLDKEIQWRTGFDAEQLQQRVPVLVSS